MKGENIDRFKIFERDGWVCYICKQAIDRTLRFPNQLAATLEHVVPLGLGGTHTEDNVATAHARCNFSKGCNIDYTE